MLEIDRAPVLCHVEDVLRRYWRLTSTHRLIGAAAFNDQRFDRGNPVGTPERRRSIIDELPVGCRLITGADEVQPD